VFREPEQTVPEISPAKEILEARQESKLAPPPTLIPRRPTVQKPSRIFPRKENGQPSLEPKAAVQPRIFPRAAPALHKDEPSDSTRRTSDIIKSPVREVVASHEVSSREETRRSEPSVSSKPVVVPELRKHELLKWSGVQPVVPTVRSLPPIRPLPPASPTINVTIGRVEIRAVSPPAQQQAKPKPPTVLSLEDYLRQRSKGVSR